MLRRKNQTYEKFTKKTRFLEKKQSYEKLGKYVRKRKKTYTIAY